jgi:hypothetical protein
VRLTTPPHKKILLRNLKRSPRPTQGCRDDVDDEECTNYSLDLQQIFDPRPDQTVFISNKQVKTLSKTLPASVLTVKTTLNKLGSLSQH